MCSERNAADHRPSTLQNGKEKRYTPPGLRLTYLVQRCMRNFVPSPLPHLPVQVPRPLKCQRVEPRPTASAVEQPRPTG